MAEPEKQPEHVPGHVPVLAEKPGSSPTQRPLLVIDIETTGQNRLLHWMPCFAACLVETNGNCPEENQFLCYLEQTPGSTWDEHCLKRFWKNPKKAVQGVLLYDRLLIDASAHGQWEPAAALSRFWGWLRRMVTRYPSLQVASDNPSYDIAWLDHYLQLYCPTAQSMAYCTGEWRAILDVRSFAAGQNKTITGDRNHNPLQDALQIAHAFLAL